MGENHSHQICRDDVWAALDRYVSVRDALRSCPANDVDRVVDELAALIVAHGAAASESAARLRRVLAVERGDQSQAPEGWAYNGTTWSKRGAVVGFDADDGVRDWRWRVHVGCRSDFESTALEAMEAADAVLAEVTR